jgi:tetratricopeptide (TPR) repeat protein
MKPLHAVPLVLVLLLLSAGVGVAVARFVMQAPEAALEEPVAVSPAAAPDFERHAVREPRPAESVPAVHGGARWAEQNKRAIAHLDAGELDEAIRLFEECRKGMPGEVVFDRNLAEALVRKAVRDQEQLRPCGHCVELVERALELDPSREDLNTLLGHWKREAEAEKDFWRESSLHFDLAYDGSRDEILWGSHRILSLLESAYTDFGELFGRHPVEEGQPRIAVTLYRRESFDALTGLGDWAGGAFDGTVRVPVGDFELEEARLRRILRHELVHAFVRAVGGRSVPGWLNEGLAQWLEDGRERGLEAARAELAGHELFSLERLQGSLASWDDADAISLAYAQSLLLTDHIAHHYGDRLVFQMVEGCLAGTSPADTFRERAQVDIEVVLGDLADELR